MINSSRILVTGAAGFIGSALVKKLLLDNLNILGLDNLNTYYSQKLKEDRLKNIELLKSKNKGNWSFEKGDLVDREKIFETFSKFKPDVVVNLAAQAGVRYSIDNPDVYIQSNILGFSNLLDACKKNDVKNLIFASSSSVYGGNKKIPFTENDPVDHPVSLYAATKKANELVAHSYSHIYNLPCTGLRFFTVYGPWGRPDMAPMIFTKLILENKPIDIFNFGKMQRDFTYIDDVVEAIYRCCCKPATSDNNFDFYNPSSASSFAPYRIFNLGNSDPVDLLEFIKILEEELGVEAIKNYKDMQIGDVVATASDNKKLNDWIGFSPKTKLRDGVRNFVNWYKNYYLKL